MIPRQGDHLKQMNPVGLQTTQVRPQTIKTPNKTMLLLYSLPMLNKMRMLNISLTFVCLVLDIHFVTHFTNSFIIFLNGLIIFNQIHCLYHLFLFSYWSNKSVLTLNKILNQPSHFAQLCNFVMGSSDTIF